MATTAEHIGEDAARFEPAPAEQRVLLQNANWTDYQGLDELRGESAVPRLTYLHGSLELMTPGLPHATDKTRLGRLIEAWADERGRADGRRLLDPEGRSQGAGCGGR